MTEEKLLEAINNGLDALKKYRAGDKRKTLYYLDHAKDELQASLYLILAEIEEEEENGKS